VNIGYVTGLRLRACAIDFCATLIMPATMIAIHPDALETALLRLSDGNLFERFAKAFLASYLGYDFIPAGGIHDKGIDGFERAHTRKDAGSFIYQISIDQDWRLKIIDSIQKLKDHKIKVDAFYYVTNRAVKNKEPLIDELVERFHVPVTIYDLDWFKFHVNSSEQTINAYRIWLESNFHEYTHPGKSFELADLTGDPRLFVFLRQEVDTYGNKQRLDAILVDSLILFALEGTDPDRGKLMLASRYWKRYPDWCSLIRVL
jgi:hypothetical protein